jgi:molybdopterin synthase catalytic subunit
MFALTDQPIDLGALIAQVADDTHGAICSFLGVTRQTSPGDPRPVEALDYQAYAKMVIADFEAIAGERSGGCGPRRDPAISRPKRECASAR